MASRKKFLEAFLVAESPLNKVTKCSYFYELYFAEIRIPGGLATLFIHFNMYPHPFPTGNP